MLKKKEHELKKRNEQLALKVQHIIHAYIYTHVCKHTLAAWILQLYGIYHAIFR